MTQVVLDDELSSKFFGFSKPLEICDANGRVVGKFIPSVDYAVVERARPPLSDEELARRNQSPSYTTAEVLARLKGLEGS